MIGIAIFGIAFVMYDKNKEIEKLREAIQSKEIVNVKLYDKAKRVDELEIELRNKDEQICKLQDNIRAKNKEFNELNKKLQIELKAKNKEIKDINKVLDIQIKEKEYVIKNYNQLSEQKEQLVKKLKEMNVVNQDDDYYESLFNYLDTFQVEEEIDEEVKKEFLNNQSIKEEYLKDGIDIDNIRDRAKILARNNIWNDEAIELNNILIVYDINDLYSYTRLAKCYLVKKDYFMAEKMYKLVLKLDRHNTIAINGLNKIKKLILNEENEKKYKLISSKYEEILTYLRSVFKEDTINYDYNEKYTIFYEDEYHPYRKGTNKSFRTKEDGNILRLKENNVEIIEQITEVLSLKLKKLNTVFNKDNIIIVSMPSSTVGNKNGINFVAKKISEKLQWSDESDSLKRVYNIEKLSYGGNRNKYIHLNSIEYIGDYTNLDEKIIILMDDVITTGNSLGAVREILIAYGAKYIITIGIAKTFDEFYSNEEKVKIWNC